MDQRKNAAREQFAAWLEEYERVRSSSELGAQAEATTRTWTERLLELFGWDPGDPRQVIQEYRLTEAEERRLPEGTHHNRPDYSLLIGGRRLVYLETKRFGGSIDSDATSLQVRSYGWSTGLKLSYAFDVEQFAVYDCRLKPSADDEGHVGLVRLLGRREYLERFDELWDYLGREPLEGGSLDRRHPDDQPPKGALPLDRDFEEKLSVWRRELATAILKTSEDEAVRDPRILSAATQRILDRIIFLRFCEGFELEELGTLLRFATDEYGFWKPFMEEHESRYRKVYDGILFPIAERDDPTGVERHLREWWLKGKIFRALVSDLYAHAYRFDAIPIDLLGGIYERYLGKRLQVVGKRALDEFKPENQRTKGAVYTPPWVVRRILERTLDPLVEGLDPEEILELRILDPACGSGSFLIGVCEYLERRILDWFHDHPRDARRAAFVSSVPGEPGVRAEIFRTLVETCVHGVDVDAEAVEVARMSLALRYLERKAREGAERPEKMLAGIGKNIRQGNSLVGSEIVTRQTELFKPRQIPEGLMPFVWEDRERGFGAVMADGGFHAVVGNPPYIEVKHYRQEMPALYEYLKDGGHYETAAEGKVDIAMPFIERSVKLLRPGGRLGFIVQNRFFKTEYGEGARRFLLQNRLLDTIEDFRDLQIFEGRTTYTAILILGKGKKRFRYRCYAELPSARAGKPALDQGYGFDEVDPGIWSLDQPDLALVHRELAKRHGTLGDVPGLRITVGLQTLYGKLYQFDPVEVTSRTMTGRNGDGEEVRLERAALRPLCRNQGFYPLRRDNADAWVIFPYEVKGEEARELQWPEFKERFPLAARYLEERKSNLKKAVETESGPKRWHLYLYPKNLASQAHPKLLFPMTIEDTMAAVDAIGDVYQDNVNVNAVVPVEANCDLHAISAVFNSTAFNALAMLKAGLNEGGWRKFNRQFAEPVPFPFKRLKGEREKRLAELARQIEALQPQLVAASGEGERAGVEGALGALWTGLDAAVEDLYELTKGERAVIARYPRKVDRVKLLIRQAGGDRSPAESAND